MSLHLIIHIIEWLGFIPLAYSITYIFFFSLLSLLPKKRIHRQTDKNNRFLVVLPAYAEDSVIIDSAEGLLRQTYERDKYDIAVVSDHMHDSTNKHLLSLPITTFLATYDNSTKAKALQLCINKTSKDYDYIVILDADNRVADNFLSELNSYCTKGTIALQAHRTAKNANSQVAQLDGASEEINNTIFREAHNKIGMASALIGSGMCLDYHWFCEHVKHLTTAGEDKELEEALLAEGHMITYLPDLLVLDEKVQNGQNFGKQRRRWIAAQLYTVQRIGKRLPWAMCHGRWNLVDKWIQNTLIPRSICMVIVPIMAICMTLITWTWALKWWIITIMLITSLSVSLPKRYYNIASMKAILKIPFLVGRMIGNLTKIKGAEKEFDHTTHGTR